MTILSNMVLEEKINQTEPAQKLAKVSIKLIPLSANSDKLIYYCHSKQAGFCASVPVSRIAELDDVFTPGRYVGMPEEDDDFDFAERFTALKAEFEEQLKEEARLNELIKANLAKIEIPEKKEYGTK